MSVYNKLIVRSCHL